MTDNPQQPYGAPGQPESKFGTDSYDPGVVGQELAEPQGMGRLRMLTLLSMAIYIVSGIIAAISAQSEELLRSTLESQPGMTEELIDQSLEIAMITGLAMTIGLLVVAVILYLVVFFGLRKAKSWARILGTVFAGLGIVITVWSLFTVGPMLEASPGIGWASIIVSILFVLVNIWWLITAFSKDVNAYISAKANRF